MNKILSGRLPHLLAVLAFFALISISFFIPLPEAMGATSQDDFNINQGLTQNLGCTGFDCQLCNLVTLINRLISFFIYVGTIAAIFIMAWVGLKYILSGGDPGATAKAKGIFWNVIWGFVIMLCAYLFIDTVMKVILSDKAQEFGPWNPVKCVDLSTIDGGTGGTGGGTGPGGTGPGGTSGGSAQHSANVETLRKANIGVVSSGGCSNPSGTGCTALDKTTPETISAVIAWKDELGYPINVTGGNEVIHRNPEQLAGRSLDVDFKDQSLGENTVAINWGILVAERQGRCAVWEVPSGSTCPTGVTRCIVVGHATGGHYSFYMNSAADRSCR